jgi:hypothetical protein
MAELGSTPYLTPLQPVFAGFKGDIVTVTADAPLPPGSRVKFDLRLVREGRAVGLFGKVVTATLLKEGVCRLTIRLHTMSREDRNALISENRG